MASPSPFTKVRSTLLPLAPDSPTRRSSYDSQSSSRSGNEKSRSRSLGRRRSQKHKPRDSTATATTTGDEVMLEAETESSTAAGVQSIGDETSASASQILERSDVFRAPTRHEVREGEEPEPADVEGGATARRRRSLRRRLSRNRRRSEDSVPAAAASPSASAQATSPSGMFPSAGLTDLARAAGAITDRSKRMGSRLATGGMGIFEKVTGMWQAEVRHYGPAPGMPEDSSDPERPSAPVGGADPETFHRRFRAHFALPAEERLVATYWAFFYQTIPLYGKIYLGRNYFCYRSMIPTSGRKLVLPLKDVESTDRDSTYKRNGLVVTIRGHEEIFFDFTRADHRDDCGALLRLGIEAAKALAQASAEGGTAADAEYNWLKAARGEAAQTDRERNLLRRLSERGPAAPPILFDDPRASVLSMKPEKPMRITCLTIGSRGDVQPYIALGKRLMQDGHHVRIATHIEFEDWIRGHGIDFKPVVGDPGELMRICIEYGMFTYQFLREASSKVSCIEIGKRG
jgi:sterol 3beta-glucosyltransferase